MGALRDYYYNECVPALKEEFGYTNIMQVPKLEKIVLNMGLGEAVQNPKIIDGAVDELTRIAGTEGSCHQGEKVDSRLQIERGDADRLPSHASW